MSHNPFEELRLLLKRINETLEPIGLEIINGGFVPDASGIDVLQLMCKINPEAILTPEELAAAAVDDEFAALVGGLDVSIDVGDPESADDEAPVEDGDAIEQAKARLLKGTPDDPDSPEAKLKQRVEEAKKGLADFLQKSDYQLERESDDED